MAEPRNFQVDLWEGVPAVFNRFEDGRKTLTDMIEYFTKRQALEEHYAKDLQKLNSRPNQATEARTFGASWAAVKLDTEIQMRIRYDFCSKLTKDILTELNTLKTDQTKQKNQLSTLVTQLQADLDKKGKALIKAKTAFHQKSEAAESALSQFEKSQQDPTFPPKSLTKLNAQQQKLRKEAELADQQYHATVLDHQAFQITYEQKMKESLQEFQQMEEARLAKLSACLEKYHKFQDDIMKELAKSQEALGDAISKINWPQDLQQFIAENRTDKVPLPPVEYVPYKQQYSHPNQPTTGARVVSTRSATNTSASVVAKKPSTPQTSGLRKARALYDYAAADETELSFDVGDIITVTKIDDSGWWEGTLNGRSGMYPGNYCELIEEGAVATPPPAAAAAAAAAPPVRKCKVTYDFTAENPDELTIREGEIIIIDLENEGWFSGTNTRGQSGLFPANYVQVLE